MTTNDAERERLVEIVHRLTPREHTLEAMPGWTIGSLLAHLAFWDRLVIERWTRATADGAAAPPGLSEALTDIINAASQAQWWALPGPVAGAEAIAAAEAVDAYVATLAPVQVTTAQTAGLDRLVDRSRHRAEHLDAIEAALAAAAPSR